MIANLQDAISQSALFVVLMIYETNSTFANEMNFYARQDLAVRLVFMIRNYAACFLIHRVFYIDVHFEFMSESIV